MRARAFLVIALAFSACAGTALAGGSNYGITPGTKPLSGKISEFPVPTPKFARDPAPGPDGNIYITVMFADRIARFDTKTHEFKEWDLPSGTHPHGLLVDKQGKVWYTGNGNGTLGELDPATGKTIQYKTRWGGSPHTLVLDDAGTIWFTNQSGHLGKLERDRDGNAVGKIVEYRMSGGPYGLALDKQGNVWVCRMGADKLGKLDPKTGQISELDMGAGSHPRRMAAAPDGTLWVTLYGTGKLAHVDPAASKVIHEYDMPAGPDGGPYAVTVDAAGRVFASEIERDTVAMLDPKTEKFQVFKLPSKNVGIRKAIVDAQGRLWYMGSHNGRLGVIE
jgi:virginiamycin B lyase